MEAGRGDLRWTGSTEKQKKGPVQETAYAKFDPCTPASRYCPAPWSGHRQTSYCCLRHTLSHTHAHREIRLCFCALDACSHTQDCLFIFHKPPVKRLLQDTVCFLCWHVHAIHSLMARAMGELCQTTLEDASRRFLYLLQCGAHYNIFGTGVLLCVGGGGVNS